MQSNELITSMIQKAVEARKTAYAPYSRYSVGAVLLTQSGKIYQGANIENAAYPDSICAERVAIFKAISEGENQFETIVVASENGGSPCGSCRQVMAEFGTGTRVLIVDGEGNLVIETTVAALLPHFFGPEDLQDRE